MCKDALANLGANKTPRAIVHAGKAAGNLRDIMTQYDATKTIDHGSGMHTRQSEDVASIVKELHKQRVFGHTTGRKHLSFPTFCSNTFLKIDKAKLNTWMKESLRVLVCSSNFNQQHIHPTISTAEL